MINDLFYQYIEAIEFATKAHDGQNRRFGSKEPYICHPVRASRIVLEATEVFPLERRMKLAIATVLHDIIEDTTASANLVEDTFGRDIRLLVESVTKNTTLPKADKEVEFLLRFKQSTVDTVMIKLADRLDNLNSMAHAPADFKRKYVANTKQLLQAIPDVATNDKYVKALKTKVTETMQRYE